MNGHTHALVRSRDFCATLSALSLRDIMKSTLTILMFATGIVLTACGTSSPLRDGAEVSREVRSFGSSSDPTIRYLILGDSTAVGVGGTYEEGIAVATSRHLAQSRRVIMTNLAVSGAQVTDVLEKQLPGLGRFIPDVVLLDIGANDVTHLTSARSLERDLRSIIEHLISINCEVKTVVTGAPAMSTPPRIPRLLRGVAGWRTEVLNKVFRKEVERYDLTFAPIAEKTGPLFAQDKTLFSDDAFHPSDRGYQTWIDVINPALDHALASQPSHCGM